VPTFPSNDPRLMQPCPNPACMAIMEQANTYVHQRLAGRLAPDYVPLFGSADYLALQEQLIAALAVGDLETTKLVCREWCKLVVRWTNAQRTSTACGVQDAAGATP